MAGKKNSNLDFCLHCILEEFSSHKKGLGDTHGFFYSQTCLGLILFLSLLRRKLFTSLLICKLDFDFRNQGLFPTLKKSQVHQLDFIQLNKSQVAPSKITFHTIKGSFLDQNLLFGLHGKFTKIQKIYLQSFLSFLGHQKDQRPYIHHRLIWPPFELRCFYQQLPI